MQIYTAAMITRPDQIGRTVLYARVSTAEQTIAHQRTQAEAAGFVIDDVIEDEGVSGVQIPLAEREGGKRLFDLLRDDDVLLCRWVDRLGRNYDDIQKNIRLFLDRGVTIKTVINGMTFDAKPQDAMGKAVRDAMLSFMSAMAEAQAVAMKEAQAAGIAHAREAAPMKYKGRKPSFTAEQLMHIEQLSQQGVGNNEIARQVGLSKFAVSRILKDVEAAQMKLGRWE
jgi:putative DNA-invertase from lambdoid prophage Rac